MAVEIIPKPAQKLPLWQNILFYFSISLLIASVCSYFVLNHFIKKAETHLADFEETLIKKTPAEEALETEVLEHQKKIKDFAQLIDQHLYSSKFFDFFQKLCHPRIWFSQVSLNPPDNQVAVSGEADNFVTIGQQMLIFEQESLIKEVNLSQLSIGERGNVTFTLSLSLDPEVFK